MPATYEWCSSDTHAFPPGLPPFGHEYLAVDQLFELLRRFGTFGSLEGGGISRLAASDADGAARREFAQQLERAGAEVGVDAVGNVHGRFALAGADAPWILCGSHLDSQPRAGELDGTYGVLAGLCAAQALMRAREAGVTFSSNLCLVNWCNEEGARFQPSMLGSAVYAGKLSPEIALSRKDAHGIELGDALGRIGFLGGAPIPVNPRAYIELHIEQGPMLEAAGLHLGVVRRNWGAVKQKLVFVGAQAHTGPTPMAERRDALLAASRVIVKLRQLAEELGTTDSPLHTSVGRIHVEPNSPNTVAARAEIDIELRSADPAVLERARACLHDIATSAAQRDMVRFECASTEHRPAKALSAKAQRWIDASASRLGVALMAMDTISGHDALNLIDLCEVGLIFVPSAGGITHHPDESTPPADLALGLRALTDVLWSACTEPLASGEPN
ncbi:N-carbamoyl-L-amino-acid hydrolase [Variovorax sp. YR750]|uniref:Zn-dependent hydrolase n=1 Tax=Variovorax sp. YR750 TaxID=1884384 RepID=UPI0008C1BB8B|nr:Zn-dependent hydrolase [Variovorax sp. YR750]SEM04770.1 N-carbamoyl-L-amino-acid hydrolase [Variovorax sp. YR750]